MCDDHQQDILIIIHKQEFLLKDEHEPDEGGDNVAEPVVSSIGQEVVHLPVVRQNQIQF